MKNALRVLGITAAMMFVLVAVCSFCSNEYNKGVDGSIAMIPTTIQKFQEGQPSKWYAIERMSDMAHGLNLVVVTSDTTAAMEDLKLWSHKDYRAMATYRSFWFQINLTTDSTGYTSDSEWMQYAGSRYAVVFKNQIPYAVFYLKYHLSDGWQILNGAMLKPQGSKHYCAVSNMGHGFDFGSEVKGKAVAPSDLYLRLEAGDDSTMIANLESQKIHLF